MTDTEKIKLAEDLYNDPSTTQKEKALLEKLFPEIKPVYFLEIPAGDVAPAEEDGPLEDIFPESRENEDERIRKAIIKAVEEAFAAQGIAGGDLINIDGFNMQEMIVYLEKQKEQKPSEEQPMDEKIQQYLIQMVNAIRADDLELSGLNKEEVLEYLEKQKEQQPVEKLSKEECVKKFKALCDAYEIKLPNREYDIYGLCGDLHKLFGDIQKPAEWSEEDEKCIKDIVDCLKYLEMEDTERQYNGERNVNPKRYANMIAKLKSLRPQPHWKPSEEQMEALSDAWLACDDKEKCKLLSSLYDDLKKL